MRKIFPHICLMLCVLFLIDTTFSQDKLQPQQIDVYQADTINFDDLKEKVNQFIKRINSESQGTRGFMVVRLFPKGCKAKEKLEQDL